HFRLGVRRLTANVGVIELEQKLSLADVIAFMHQQASYGGGDGGMCFEILYWLDFAVGGNHAANGAALDQRGVYLENLTTGQQRDEHGRSDYSGDDPADSPARRRMRIV